MSEPVPFKQHQPVWVENSNSTWHRHFVLRLVDGNKVDFGGFGIFHQSKVCDEVKISHAPTLLEQIEEPGVQRTRALSALRFLVSHQNSSNRRPLCLQHDLIPKMIKIIRTGNWEDQLAACWIVRHGGRGDIEMLNLMFKEGVISAVVPLLSPSNPHDELHSIAVQCVTAITYSPVNKGPTIQMGVLPPLTQSIQADRNPADVFIALSNMAGDFNSSRAITNHGIFDLIDMDKVRNDDKLLMDCLKMISSLVAAYPLAASKTVQKKAILEKAVEVVQRGNCQRWTPESLESWALTLIQRIALFEFARGTLVKLNTIEILSRMVEMESYQSMKATMAVAILVGREDQAKAHNFLEPSKIGSMKALLQLFENVVKGNNGQGYSAGIFSLTEVSLVFRNLCVGDTSKKLASLQQIHHLLIKVLNEKDNEPMEAIEHTIALLLDMSKAAKKHFARNADLVPALRKWHSRPEISHNMRNYLHQLLMEFDYKYRSTGLQVVSEKDSQEKRVFISYSWFHQPIIMKIANELKDRGMKVWFDLDQKMETTEDIADCLATSCAIIVDVCQQYQESANTRLEGQLALQLGIPAIPVFLEDNYNANGWLALLLRSTQCPGIKFYEGCDFEQSFQRIIDSLLSLGMQIPLSG